MDLNYVVAEELKNPENGLKMKDRTILLKTYPKTFTGSELVDWIIDRKFLNSREEALLTGKLLLSLNYMFSISKDIGFEDGGNYYKLNYCCARVIPSPESTVALIYKITNQTPQAIFDAWSGPKHGAMIGSYSTGCQGKANDNFRLMEDYIQGITTEVKPGRYLKQYWRTRDFKVEDCDSVLEVSFEKHNEGAVVTVIHSKIPQGTKDFYTKFWREKYFAEMKKYFDHSSWESRVDPHSTLNQLTPNLLTISGLFPVSEKTFKTKCMAIYKMKNGNLWVYSPTAINTKLMEQIDQFGKVQYIVQPNCLHRRDSLLFKQRYADAKLVTINNSNAVKLIGEVCKVDDTCQNLQAIWSEQGIHIMESKFCNGNELTYLLELSERSAALCFGETITWEIDNPTQNTDLGVSETKCQGRYITDASKLQGFLFNICDTMDNRLSTFTGRQLEVIVMLHGPPIYKGSNPYTHPLWALRYKCAMSSPLPPCPLGSLTRNPQDLVKAGWVYKSRTNCSDLMFRKRYVELYKDGRLVLYTDNPETTQDYVVKEHIPLLSRIAVSIEFPGKENCFLLRYFSKSSENYYFAVSTKEELMDWTTAINIVSLSYIGCTLEETISTQKYKYEDFELAKIINFWFFLVEPKGKLTKDNLCYWLLVANGCDNFIYKNFFPLWERAKNNELDKWLLNPVKTVALVIMLDQFTRCIYRDTPQMFSMDERTLEIVELALEKNFDKQLAPAMRLWLYLPLIRKEDVAVSCKLQSLVEELVVETDPEEKEFWGSVMNYIQVHQQILKQHGRYPMINEALGRKSTFLEALWLRTNPSDFSYF